jgi:hypothetical protein
MSRQFGISGKPESRRTVLEVESRILRWGGDDTQRLNALFLQRRLRACHLGNRAPAERAPQSDEESQEQRTLAEIVLQRDGAAAVDGGEGEPRRWRARRYG